MHSRARRGTKNSDARECESPERDVCQLKGDRMTAVRCTLVITNETDLIIEMRAQLFVDGVCVKIYTINFNIATLTKTLLMAIVCIVSNTWDSSVLTGEN